MIDSRWIVLPIADIAKSVPTLEEFDVFDRATGRLDQRIPIAASPRIGTWALFKGHVYWTEPRSGSSGRLLDRDVTARTTRTVASDGARNLLGSPTGVAWTDAQNQRHVLAGTSPDQVPGLAGTHAGLVSDGRSYAWFGSGGITWYSTATKQTVVVRWFPGLDVTVRAVAGPYVLIESGQLGASGWLIDTRTGAAASFQSTSSVASGNGVLAYSAESTVVLHVDQLPRLAC